MQLFTVILDKEWHNLVMTLEQEAEQLRAENGKLYEQLAMALERIVALEAQIKAAKGPPAFVKPKQRSASV